VPIKRTMIENAGCVALLADAEKFSMAGMVWVTDAGSLDHIVTDAPLPDACGTAVEASGVEVSVA
jgi:DeoR/GlpR family transcriptional regulator of sugar metabolism